jgi:glutathione S-transferase
MYTLHIGNKNYSSWSLRPWVLMRHLGIAFNEQMHKFGDEANWAAYRRISPNGRVPCLQDGPTTVWDSLAIAEYLADRHPGVWPADANTRAWARSAAAEMHSGFGALRNACSMSCGVRIQLPEIAAPLQTDINRIDQLWTDGLKRFHGPFLAGSSFTAVDAFFAPVASRVQTYGLKLGEVAAAYAVRLLALPAMRSWYEDALREAWRDAAHEGEIMASGTLLQDLRIHSD